MDHLGAVLELWDKDPNGTDEKIGSFVYNIGGGTCWTFEWDNNSSANAEHEQHPDVYAKYLNQVKNTGNSRAVTAKKSDGTAHQVLSWRNGEGGLPDKFVVNNCATGECWIFGAGYLLPSGDVNTDVAKRAMVLDSAQHTLQVFSSVMTTDVNIEVPDSECGSTTACAWTKSRITVPDSMTTNGGSVSHEVGHTVQMQRFVRDSLRSDCSQNGGGWWFDTSEFDSCATQEGWASYVGLASWYDGGVANVSPNLWGNTFETATPLNSTCSANRAFALQTTKAFWDMDDVTNEAGAGAAGTRADVDAWFPDYIARQWDRFADGSSNRQDNESDVHGVNVRDYRANNAAVFNSATITESLLDHNCLQSQDDN